MVITLQKSIQVLQREVFSEFYGRCCGIDVSPPIDCAGKAEVVHEIEPRSRGLSTHNKDNMIPLCSVCHSYVHDEGASDEQVVRLHRVKSAMKKRLYGHSENTAGSTISD